MKNMNRYLALVALIISLISCQSEDNPNRYELIPYPNDMEQMSGRFSFDDDTQILISPECGDEVNEILAQFAEQFGKTAGKDLKIAEKEGKNMMIVKIDTTMSQEAYRLNISKKKIEITAATPNGVRYALQTVKQLLPVAIYGESLSAVEKWSDPCATIRDAPRRCPSFHHNGRSKTDSQRNGCSQTKYNALASHRRSRLARRNKKISTIDRSGQYPQQNHDS